MKNLLEHTHDLHVAHPTEVNKLHLSFMLMTLGTSLVGIFIPVYLLSLDYSVLQVAVFYLAFQTLAWCADMTSGFLTARFGPKHIMRLSMIFRIFALIALYKLSDYDWLFFVLPALLAALGMHTVAYFTEFSKLAEVKPDSQTSDEEGKQLGRAFTASRIASASGPLIGGLIITYFSIKVNLIIAIATVFIAALILNGHEPVKTHQKTKLRLLDMQTVKPDLWGAAGMSLGFIAGGVFYGIFLVEFVLDANNQYSLLGLIATVSFVISVSASLVVGKLADKGYGWRLVKASTFLASIVDISRAFFLTPMGTGVVNAPGASVAVGIRIPLFKAMYKSVNRLEGFRISYFMKLFSLIGFLRIMFWVIFIALYYLVELKLAMQIMFVISGLSGLTMLKSKKLYDK